MDSSFKIIFKLYKMAERSRSKSPTPIGKLLTDKYNKNRNVLKFILEYLGAQERRQLGKSSKSLYELVGGKEKAKTDYEELATRDQVILRLVNMEIQKSGGLQALQTWLPFKNIPAQQIKQSLVQQKTQGTFTKQQLIELYKTMENILK